MASLMQKQVKNSNDFGTQLTDFHSQDQQVPSARTKSRTRGGSKGMSPYKLANQRKYGHLGGTLNCQAI